MCYVKPLEYLPDKKVLVFSHVNIRNYLDRCIRYWRKKKDEALGNGPAATNDHDVHTATCYVDAYQSVRNSIYGELLPKE